MKFFSFSKKGLIALITFTLLFCFVLNNKIRSTLDKNYEPPTQRKNPNARDVGMEAIVQNTANVAYYNNAYRSNIDLQRSRYAILGSSNNQDVKSGLLDPPKNIYQKDKDAYYPYVDPLKETVPVVDQVRMDRPLVYDLDKKAYYNPTGEFKVIPKPYIGKVVTVDMAELQNTFPSEKNLQGLKTQLKAINLRENLDYNAVYQKGIYYKDPKAYYDPTLEDTVNSVKDLQNKIVSMEKDLNDNIKNNIVANLATIKVHQEVENQVNSDSEQKNKVVKDNYLTPIAKENGVDVEFPPGTKISKNHKSKPLTQVIGQKVEVDVIDHKLEEAEVIKKAKRNNSYYPTEKNNDKNNKSISGNKNE